MTKIDLPTLAAQLNALAEVFDKKPVSPKALEVWFDTLREFPCEQVMSMLLSWAKTHTKFPAPADVWKVMNEWAIDRRERQAELERRQPVLPPSSSARAGEFIRKMRAIINKPRLTQTQHWELALSRQKPGAIGYEYAKLALGNREERVPGEDDEARS